MRVIELFAGIGACSRALERLGIPVEIVDAVEIDKHAMKSFNAIHGTNFETQDILEWNKDYKDIDLITHGSPCQDFSLAGLQAGGDIGSGTRSSLMYETIRIVGKIRPKYVLWENVKNILSVKHKHNFDNYINAMEALGYKSYYQVLNAKDYGVPQNRERVFTVSIRKDVLGTYIFPEGQENDNRIKRLFNYANRNDRNVVYDKTGLAPTIIAGMGGGGGNVPMLIENNFEFPKGEECENQIQVVGNYSPSCHDASRVVDENGIAPTVKENHGTVTAVVQRFEFPTQTPLKIRLKDVLEKEVDEKYYLKDYQIENIRKSKFHQNNRRIQEKEWCDTLCARDWKDPKCVQVGTLDIKGHDCIKRVYSEEGLSPTLTDMQGGNRQPKVMINERN